MGVAGLLCLMLCLPLTAGAGNEGWFWHVTDFHYDFTYWGRMLSRTGPVGTRGIYGDYWLDSPWLLIEDSISAMAKLKPDVDFIIWTGDNVAHIKDRDLSLQINLEIMQNITNAINASFPNTTVYPTLGNHDYFPRDQAPPNNSIIYNRTAEMWKDWIKDSDQLENFRKGGYFTVKTPNNLRLVGLNTNLYYTSNRFTDTTQDPAGQFAWLEGVLQSAKTAGEKVILTAHIPPGVLGIEESTWIYPQHNKRFLQITAKYSDIILAMHFGHEHADNFKIYYNDDGTPLIPVFSAPSVTPWRFKIPDKTGVAHNPGIRLVKYDRTTGSHLNILQYYIDLPKSNAENRTSWKQEYDFTEAYGVPDISAASLDNIAQRIKTEIEDGKSTIVDKYFLYTSVSAPREGAEATCNKACKGSIFCGFRWWEMKTFKQCLEPYLETGSGVTLTLSQFLLVASLFVLLTVIG